MTDKTPRQRIEDWHLAVSEGEPEPEQLFFIADDACDRIAELERQLKNARETLVTDWSDEWMRLFGIYWYSEQAHRRIVAQARVEERERCARIPDEDIIIGPSEELTTDGFTSGALAAAAAYRRAIRALEDE